MQTRNKILDDLAQLMTNAAGVAQGMRVEAETAMKSLFERWLQESNLVTREEFDAVRDMAVKAREENERLEARIAALEAQGSGKTSAARSSGARSASQTSAGAKTSGAKTSGGKTSGGKTSGGKTSGGKTSG